MQTNEENSTISFYSSTSGVGTGKHAHKDFVNAFNSVTGAERLNALTLLAAAGITLGVLFLSRIFWLAKPLFDLVQYGLVSELIYYGLLAAIYTVYIVFLNKFIKKRCGVRLFAPASEHMPIVSALGMIALILSAVFFTSLGFRFKLKIQLEMGSGQIMTRTLTNICVYFYYGLHIWLGLTAAALIQRGLSNLLPAKYNVPWGAIALVTVYGLIEFIFEAFTTTHLYPWLYYIFTFVYAAIYELSGHRFHVTYWAAIALMVF